MSGLTFEPLYIVFCYRTSFDP